MKTLLSTMLGLLLVSTAAFGQCEEPIIEHWQYVGDPVNDQVSDQTFSIEFTAPLGAQGYNLEITSMYALDSSIYTEEEIADVHTDTGSVVAGLNNVEVTIPAAEIDQLNAGAAYHYFAVNMWFDCAGGDSSEATSFYLSTHSLINEPAFGCSDNLHNAISYIPTGEQGPGGDTASVEYEMVISSESGEELVENMSVFIDIGHTFTEDLGIFLESPQGTEVRLLDFLSTGIWFQEGLSVVFLDGAPPIFDNDDSYAGPRGFFAPYESLSAFDGEPMDGTWKITVMDSWGPDDGMLAGVCLLFDELPCTTSISGTAYYDLNQNAAFDGDDVLSSWPNIQSSIDGQSVWGGEYGSYFICSPSGTGDITMMNVPDYYTANPININGEDGSAYSNIDFPLTPIPGFEDLVIDVFSTLPDVPGTQNTYHVDYTNVGTECIDDVELSVSFPDSLVILSCNNPEVVIDNTSLTLSLGEMCPQASGSFTVTVQLDQNVAMGTLLDIQGLILPIEGDETPEDNEVVYQSEVVASFDPNDKMVSENVIYPSFMENDQSLKYTVRFQNTGTYFAQKVEIVDVIEPNLDLSTLEILAHSHPMQVSVEGDVLKFIFDDIWLTWSDADYEESQGFVRFQIEPVDDYYGPVAITNSAAIYFDFNDPIITNTASTDFQINVGVSEVAEYQARIFPNPVSSDLTVQWDPVVMVKSIQLRDISGRLVRDINVTDGTRLVLNVESLQSGMYTISFDADRSIAPMRIVKD